MYIQQYEVSANTVKEITASVGEQEIAVIASFIQKWYAFTNLDSYKRFVSFMKSEEILPDMEIHFAR